MYFSAPTRYIWGGQKKGAARLGRNASPTPACRLSEQGWRTLRVSRSPVSACPIDRAACGKDPGYTPDFLLEEADRQHYAQIELDSLTFEGNPPDAAALSQHWKKAVREAREPIKILPPAKVGQCILGMNGEIYSGTMEPLKQDLSETRILFHAGHIGGVWPTVKGFRLMG